MNPNQLYEDIIANNRDLQRMFYFGLDEEFKNWIQTQKAAEISVETNAHVDKYFKYRNIVPDITKVTFCKGKPNNNKSNTKHKGAYTNTRLSKKDANLKEIGNCGELLVYNLLCHLYGIENVFLDQKHTLN